MPIPADTSDWTWVLRRPCPDCGFDAAAVALADVPARITAGTAGWSDVLAEPAARQRPDDSTWSPLEYAAHVRDVLELFAARLHLILTSDGAVFPDWDQNAAAVQQRYQEQDPAAVAMQLAEASAELAGAIAAVPEGAAGRTGRRADGAVFTVQTLGHYALHELQHHRWDVTHDR